MASISILILTDTIKKLKAAAKRRELSMAALVRDLIHDYLKNEHEVENEQ